jgi:uncharacterized membrane protein
MSKHIRWLAAESERWTKEQIITTEQAQRIRQLYTGQSAPVSWGLIVFSGLGAVVIGLGVILLFAYNWDRIPKYSKLGIVLGAIAMAHAAGLWLRCKDGWRPTLGEVFSLLGSMLFGAGIWLIAQIYHIDEHFPNGFLFWGLGALALAWALESVPQALLATITLAIWSGSETLGFRAPRDFSVGLIFFGVGPLMWRKKSGLLAATVLAALYATILFNASFWYGAAGAFTSALSLSTLLIALSRMDAVVGLSEKIRPLLVFFGWTGFLICAYILSFEGAADSVLRWGRDHGAAEGKGMWIYSWGLFAVAAVAWVYLVIARFRGIEGGRVRLEEWLCPIALLYCQSAVLSGFHVDATLVAIVFNLTSLGIATAWMVRGCRWGEMMPVVVGSIVFALLVFARYFDLFGSLAMRGVAFLVLGGVLFAEGFYYRKLRRSEAEGGRAL